MKNYMDHTTQTSCLYGNIKTYIHKCVCVCVYTALPILLSTFGKNVDCRAPPWCFTQFFRRSTKLWVKIKKQEKTGEKISETVRQPIVFNVYNRLKNCTRRPWRERRPRATGVKLFTVRNTLAFFSLVFFLSFFADKIMKKNKGSL